MHDVIPSSNKKPVIFSSWVCDAKISNIWCCDQLNVVVGVNIGKILWVDFFSRPSQPEQMSSDEGREFEGTCGSRHEKIILNEWSTSLVPPSPSASVFYYTASNQKGLARASGVGATSHLSLGYTCLGGSTFLRSSRPLAEMLLP